MQTISIYNVWHSLEIIFFPPQDSHIANGFSSSFLSYKNQHCTSWRGVQINYQLRYCLIESTLLAKKPNGLVTNSSPLQFIYCCSSSATSHLFQILQQFNLLYIFLIFFPSIPALPFIPPASLSPFAYVSRKQKKNEFVSIYLLMAKDEVLLVLKNYYYSYSYIIISIEN